MRTPEPIKPIKTLGRGRCRILRIYGAALLIAHGVSMGAHAQDTDSLGTAGTATSLRQALATAGDRGDRLGALWALADFYQERGEYREASRYIESAGAESRNGIERSLTALRAGGIATGLGRYAQASSYLGIAIEGKPLLDAGSSIALELELGRLAAEQDALESAVAHFDTAAAEAGAAGLADLEVRANINSLRARMDD